jgi:hypothetical protein
VTRAKVIVTRATGATVWRWAMRGKKRLCKKYRNARTLCRVVNQRHGGPILGIAAGEWGYLGRAKIAWGWPAVLTFAEVEPSSHANLTTLRKAIARAEVRRLKHPSLPWGDDQMSERACRGRTLKK